MPDPGLVETGTAGSDKDEEETEKKENIAHG
jgi:hypothetical protein